MANTQSIAADLIASRNILCGNRTTVHVLPSLLSALENIDSIEVISTKKIVEYCVTEAVEQVRCSSFRSAGLILNFIHNLPLDEAADHKWDIDYFLAFEVPTFLDHYEEVVSAKEIMFFVFRVLGDRYPSAKDRA